MTHAEIRRMREAITEQRRLQRIDGYIWAAFWVVVPLAAITLWVFGGGR